jgi:hypothetical protein
MQIIALDFGKKSFSVNLPCPGNRRAKRSFTQKVDQARLDVAERKAGDYVGIRSVKIFASDCPRRASAAM